MKTLEELKAIREKMQSQVSMREEDHARTRVLVGMATCGIASGARPVLNKLSTLVQENNMTDRFSVTQTCLLYTSYSQFNNLDDVNIVLNALLMMGFHDVFEVSAAAELVSEATREYLSENPDRLPAISTACPSVVRLIRVRFPNLIRCV